MPPRPLLFSQHAPSRSGIASDSLATDLKQEPGMLIQLARFLDTPRRELTQFLAEDLGGLKLDEEASGSSLLQQLFPGTFTQREGKLDPVDLLGFGAEIFTDPLMLLGGIATPNKLGKAAKAYGSGKRGYTAARGNVQGHRRLLEDLAKEGVDKNSAVFRGALRKKRDSVASAWSERKARNEAFDELNRLGASDLQRQYGKTLGERADLGQASLLKMVPWPFARMDREFDLASKIPGLAAVEKPILKGLSGTAKLIDKTPVLGQSIRSVRELFSPAFSKNEALQARKAARDEGALQSQEIAFDVAKEMKEVEQELMRINGITDVDEFGKSFMTVRENLGAEAAHMDRFQHIMDTARAKEDVRTLALGKRRESLLAQRDELLKSGDESIAEIFARGEAGVGGQSFGMLDELQERVDVLGPIETLPTGPSADMDNFGVLRGEIAQLHRLARQQADPRALRRAQENVGRLRKSAHKKPNQLKKFLEAEKKLKRLEGSAEATLKKATKKEAQLAKLEEQMKLRRVKQGARGEAAGLRREVQQGGVSAKGLPGETLPAFGKDLREAFPEKLLPLAEDVQKLESLINLPGGASIDQLVGRQGRLFERVLKHLQTTSSKADKLALKASGLEGRIDEIQKVIFADARERGAREAGAAGVAAKKAGLLGEEGITAATKVRSMHAALRRSQVTAGATKKEIFEEAVLQDELVEYAERILTPEARAWLRARPDLDASLRQTINTNLASRDPMRLEELKGLLAEDINKIMKESGFEGDTWFRAIMPETVSAKVLGSHRATLNNIHTMGVADELAQPMANLTHGAVELAPFLKKAGVYRHHGVTVYRNGQVTKEFAEKFGGLGIDQKIAKEWLDLGHKLTSDNALKPLVKAYDAFLNAMRKYVTVPFFDFHVRNFLTNITLNWMGDAGPVKNWKSYSKALKVFRNPDSNDFRALEAAGVFKGGWSREVIASMSRNADATSMDAFMDTTAKIFKSESKGTIGKGVEKFKRNYTNWAEDISRAAHYYAKRSSGLSHTESVRSVNKYLLDFSDLTDMERKIGKRTFLFYNWTRKMIPLMFREYWENPGRMSLLTRGTAQPTTKRPDFAPEYIRESLNIPFGETPEGDPQTLTSVGSPLEELSKFDFSGAQPGAIGKIGEMVNKVLSQTNPIIKAPIEAATGQDIFLQRPILEADRAPHLGGLEKYILPGFREETLKSGESRQRANPEWMHLLRQLPVSRAMSTANTLFGPQKTAFQKASQLASGVRFSSTHPERDIPAAQFREIKKRLSEHISSAEVRTFEKLFATDYGKQNPEIMALMQKLRDLEREDKARKRSQ